MKDFIRKFMALGRRDRFAYGISLAIIFNIVLGCLLDFFSGRTPQAIVQAALALIAVALLVYYRFGHNYTLFIYGGITAASLGYNLLLYLDHFVLHSYLILIVMPLVFFFLLSLRRALIATALHFLLTVGMSYYAYAMLDIDSGMFDKNAIQVYTFGAIFIVALGIFYQLAIEETYQHLQHANAQKELLLREIHHRIKNNLNKMSSALGLQILRLHRGYSDDPEEILRKNKLRIEAMSLVHEALYQSDDIGQIILDEYIHKLVNLIEQAYGQTRKVVIAAEPIYLSPEKILRLGTLINELYTNTLKHTDPTESVTVTIEVSYHETDCLLLYRQQGHTGAVPANILENSHGLGMMLIRLTAQEMGGDLTVDSAPDKLAFRITFPC